MRPATPIAFMKGGDQIAYHGLSETPGCFEGAMLKPRQVDLDNGGWLSSLWLLSEIRWLSQPGKSNLFRDLMTGKLNRVFLRHSAVRRFFERGCIAAEQAVDLLICESKHRRAIVESWKESP